MEKMHFQFSFQVTKWQCICSLLHVFCVLRFIKMYVHNTHTFPIVPHVGWQKKKQSKKIKQHVTGPLCLAESHNCDNMHLYIYLYSSYLHNLLLDFIKLCALTSLPAHFLVTSVLLSQGIEKFHNLRLSQKLIIHWRPWNASLWPIEPPLLKFR